MTEEAKAASGVVDVELSRAIDVDGKQVQVLHMREPIVADQLALEQMKGSDANKEVTLFANLCQISPDDLRQMSLRDYRKLQQAFAGFTV